MSCFSINKRRWPNLLPSPQPIRAGRSTFAFHVICSRVPEFWTLSVILLAVVLTSCISPYREVGTLEIQIKTQGADGDGFATEGELELITSGSALGDVLSDKKRIAGQTSTFLMQETVSACDQRGDHTDYLLLYSIRQRGLARPHPQVIPIDLALKKPRGVWSDWIVPKYSEQTEDSGWNLLYRTKETRLIPLRDTPLAIIRYRIVASTP